MIALKLKHSLLWMMMSNFCCMILYSLGTYTFHSGCVKGRECENGKLCGSHDSRMCSECSFEECYSTAAFSGLAGFAYSGSDRNGSYNCKWCSASELKNLTSSSDWGVYAYKGNDHFYIFINEHFHIIGNILM